MIEGMVCCKEKKKTILLSDTQCLSAGECLDPGDIINGASGGMHCNKGCRQSTVELELSLV